MRNVLSLTMSRKTSTSSQRRAERSVGHYHGWWISNMEIRVNVVMPEGAADKDSLVWLIVTTPLSMGSGWGNGCKMAGLWMSKLWLNVGLLGHWLT